MNDFLKFQKVLNVQNQPTTARIAMDSRVNVGPVTVVLTSAAMQSFFLSWSLQRGVQLDESPPVSLVTPYLAQTSAETSSCLQSAEQYCVHAS